MEKDRRKKDEDLSLELAMLNKAEITTVKRGTARALENQPPRHKRNTGYYQSQRNIRQPAYVKQRGRLRKRVLLRRILGSSIGVLIVVLALLFFLFQGTDTGEQLEEQIDKGIQEAQNVLAEPMNTRTNTSARPQWTEDLLPMGEWTRPGEKLTEVSDIFIHYTANPGTTAAQNRSYFASLAETHERAASAHFIIGIEGEIILCVPQDEVAYAVIGRNYDSISIECCYQDEDGKFTDKTYQSLIKLLQYLVEEYDLTAENLLRHYDCGGKKCPLYYVEHEDAWEQLKKDVFV